MNSRNDAVSSAEYCRRIAGFSSRYGVKSNVYMSKDVYHLDWNELSLVRRVDTAIEANVWHMDMQSFLTRE